MARPLYSAQLLRVISTATAVSVNVPGGELWVVRQIAMWDAGGAVNDEALVVVAGVPVLAADVTSTALEARVTLWEGRHVAQSGDEIELAPISGSWGVLVSGYTLTAP